MPFASSKKKTSLQTFPSFESALRAVCDRHSWGAILAVKCRAASNERNKQICAVPSFRNLLHHTPRFVVHFVTSLNTLTVV